jgi:hypothetical protein
MDKNYRLHICLNEIGLRAQYYKLDSQPNWRDLYDLLVGTRIFPLIMNKIFV